METQNGQTDGSTPVPVNEELVLDLNFVPAWARKPPTASQFDRHGDDARDTGMSRRGGGGRDSYGHDRDRGRERERRPGRPGDRDRRPGRPGGGERGRERDRDDRGPRPASTGPAAPRAPAPMDREERFEFPPVSISIVPKPKGLSVIVHKIHTSRRAFPLSEVAGVFLSNLEFCDVKIEANRAAERIHLYQCQACKMLALDRGILLGHVLARHFDERFEKAEVESAPPTGDFVVMARCGLSGTLLAPPNHHSYAARVREVRQALYPAMGEEQYRQRIESVRDPALIEQWKASCCRQTVYRLKQPEGAASGADLSRADAESLFVRELAPALVTESFRGVLPAVIAKEMEDDRLRFSIREIWNREGRHPRSLLFALRAAFRHMHLHTFRAGGNEIFICAVAPSPLDPARAVSAIREVLLFLQDHPGCTRLALVEGLRPGQDPAGPGVSELLSPLSWLIEKGHIIEFFNGTLSVPLARRTEAPSEAHAPSSE